MAAISFKRSSVGDFNKFNSLLVGNDATIPSSYELIQSVLVATNGGNVDIQNIPQTYNHLQVRFTARAANAQSESDFIIRPNGVATSIYSFHDLAGLGSTVISRNATSQNLIRLRRIPADNMTANIFAGGVIDILDYSNTEKFTTLRAFVGFHGDLSSQININSGLFQSTDAVTRLVCFSDGNFKAGTRVSLYGIKE